MDTIRNYVDMMFKDLPKTKEVIDMKLNILDHMEDKYNELLAEEKRKVKRLAQLFHSLEILMN